MSLYVIDECIAVWWLEEKKGRRRSRELFIDVRLKFDRSFLILSCGYFDSIIPSQYVIVSGRERPSAFATVYFVQSKVFSSVTGTESLPGGGEIR